MNLTQKLDYLMARRDITRGGLAEATGIPYNTIVGFYTKGYHNMKLSTLKKLGEYFGVSLDALAVDGAPLETVTGGDVSRYIALPAPCKKIVDGVIDGLTGLQLAPEPQQEPEPDNIFYIREFVNPVAAGSVNPVLNEDYIEIPRPADTPRGADFCCRITGDSMEPYIMDGARVFVSRSNQLTDGDVGIFFVDGDMKCKQYIEDCFGNIYLLSLNRARKDADSKILASSGIRFACFGKVLMKRPPLVKP